MSDNRETSEEGADVEHGQPTPPAATSDELPADDEDAVGPPVSLSPQVSDAGESPEAEPADEVDASEAESTPAADDHKPSETKAEYSIEEMLALEQENDPQRNTETRPPAGETVTFRSVTTAEVYVGREADSLAAALGKLEWVNQDELIADNIAEARKTDEYYKAQFVLLSGPPPRPNFGGYGKSELPVGVERIYGECHVLGPSIVTLVLTFALALDEAGRLDAALRHDEKSTITRSGAFAGIDNVYKVKAKRVRRVREELAARCLAWLGEKLPGTLVASGGLGNPICSLVTLATGTPFQTQGDYMRLVDLHNDAFASRLVRPDYLVLVPPVGRVRPWEYIAAFKEADALIPGLYPDRLDIPEMLNGVIAPLVITESLVGVFGSLESRVRGVRSELEKIDLDATAASRGRLTEILSWRPFKAAADSPVVSLRNRLLGISRDIALVCGDVAAAAEKPIDIWAAYPNLAGVNSNQVLPPIAAKTADFARGILRSLMADLKGQEAGLRELVLMTSQAISDVQDTKTQKRLNGLTIALVLLTIALVVIAVVQYVWPPSTGDSSPVPTPHASTSATKAPPRPTPSPSASKSATRNHAVSG